MRSDSTEKKTPPKQKPVAGEAKKTGRLKTLFFTNELCVLNAHETKPDSQHMQTE